MKKKGVVIIEMILLFVITTAFITTELIIFLKVYNKINHNLKTLEYLEKYHYYKYCIKEQFSCPLLNKDSCVDNYIVINNKNTNLTCYFEEDKAFVGKPQS